jgi:class 3 adenylate cyclase
MPAPSPTFTFDRARGVVWVCDVANSTKFLNDNAEVDALEEYFPRLYWAALQAVGAADGVFIKWTGDGFLAWFPAVLERQLGQVANNVFTAAWHLTLLSNVTSLGVKTSAKVRLRHGVAYEPDALVLRITTQDGYTSQDLVGRAVVRAFRMSGIGSGFPGVVTEGTLVKSYEKTEERPITFEKRNISQEERLKYFKGERLGTTAVFFTAETPKRTKKL